MLVVAVLGFSVIGCEAEEEPIEEEEVGEELNGEEAPDEGEVEKENGFEEAKPQLEEHLKQEKEQELIMEHLEDLEAESDVEKYPEVIDEGEDGTVVAEVNGEQIFIEQYQQEEEQQMQMMMQQGMDPESAEMSEMLEELRPQILDNLVNSLLIEKKVEEEGMTVSEDEVDEEYQMFAEQSGGEEMLEQQLEEAGYTAEELREDISQQLKIQTYMEGYIEENLDTEDLEFSEEELRELYEETQQQQEQIEMDLEEGS